MYRELETELFRDIRNAVKQSKDYQTMLAEDPYIQETETIMFDTSKELLPRDVEREKLFFRRV